MKMRFSLINFNRILKTKKTWGWEINTLPELCPRVVRTLGCILHWSSKFYNLICCVNYFKPQSLGKFVCLIII